MNSTRINRQPVIVARRGAGRRGLSIVELMLSLAVSGMLLTAVAAGAWAAVGATQGNDQFVRASHVSRVCMDQMTTQLRRCDSCQVAASDRVEIITDTGHDWTYQYFPSTLQLKLIQNDVSGKPSYVLANNVTAATFTADTVVDPVTSLTKVVRVSIVMSTQVGKTVVTVNDTVAPRRAL
jgi:Tfp pilus assembly protein PilW